jgi:hypothetical protein
MLERILQVVDKQYLIYPAKVVTNRSEQLGET